MTFLSCRRGSLSGEPETGIRAHFVSDPGPVKKPSQTPHEESERESETERDKAPVKDTNWHMA